MLRAIQITICAFLFQVVFILRYTLTRSSDPKHGTSSATYQIKIRPDIFDIINPTEPKYPLKVKYILEPKTLCSAVANLTFLVIVLSSTTNFLKRQMVRQTWANESLYSSYGKMKVLFLLGLGSDSIVQNKINIEFSSYGDILQGEFIDTYRNLTHKSTMGLRWATERCRNAMYVLKTDDDIVINMFELFQHRVVREKIKETHVLCHRQSTRVIRDEQGKWFIEPHQFKGFERFPFYCGGLFVLILNELVPFLYTSVSRSPFFWIEDVLLYGIALDNIPGLNIEAIPVEIEDYNLLAQVRCLKKKGTKCPLFIFMTKHENEIELMWEHIVRVYKNYEINTDLLHSV